MRPSSDPPRRSHAAEPGLLATRLAASLSMTALERRSGVHRNLLSGYECERSEPKWRSLAKLIRVFGVEWLAVK